MDHDWTEKLNQKRRNILNNKKEEGNLFNKEYLYI